MYPWLNAYIDESGTNVLEFDKQGTSYLYICVAILIEQKNVSIAEEKMKSLSEKLNNGSEIKSNKVGTNHTRRKLFLETIQDIPFTYFALIVNKNNIYKDSGLKYKKTYYKYISRLLYNKIVSDNYNINIIADEMGSEEYINSVQKYFNDRKFPDLFTQVSYKMKNSKDEPLIQLADLVAGSLTYCFDENKDLSYASKFWELLKNKEIGIQCWPLNIIPKSDTIPEYEEDYNKYYKKCALNKAIKFIETYEDSGIEEEVMQSRVVSYLIFTQEFIQTNKAITADTLIMRLKAEGFKIERQTFSSSIIGKIRDSGIIISGSHNGYYIALTLDEIKGYLDHNKTVIEPMLWRLKKADETVKSYLQNKYDIFADPSYQQLNELLNCYKTNSIKQYIEKTND
ncbi:DUF3800 domain-containing protein [bacterium]|nr:DUF3800 domain-containing protein [bacterium]